MSIEETVRAWKDEGYRNSLTPEQRMALLPNPAGVVELDDEALEEAAGGVKPNTAGRVCSFFSICSFACTYVGDCP